MRVIVVGRTRTIGSTVLAALSARHEHEVVVVGRNRSAVHVGPVSADSIRAAFQSVATFKEKSVSGVLYGLPRNPPVRHRGSVFHAHAYHDEHRIALLRTALDERNCASRRNGQRRLRQVGR